MVRESKSVCVCVCMHACVCVCGGFHILSVFEVLCLLIFGSVTFKICL